MQDFLFDYYLWLKAMHIISVICWMAVMFYLPRLFIYHCEAEKGSDKSETFKVMERRLLRFIGNPSMISSWFFAILILIADPDLFLNGWMHVKLTCVLLLSAFHGMCAGWMKKFARDENTKPQKFYRFANEFPTILMLVIVIMAVVKPF